MHNFLLSINHQSKTCTRIDHDASLREAFFAGYASIRQIPKCDTIMPLLRLNRAIAVIGFLIRENTWQGQYAEMYQINRQFFETFFKK